ncbi:hypothetical protein JCM1840_004074 [Sporobolomyces johnsonii]
MASPWKSYLNRSLEHLRDRSAEVLRAQPTGGPGEVLPLLSLKSQDDLKQFVVGCDADLGGKSTVNLDLGPESKGRFWGTLSSELNAGRRKEGVIERGGYAGMRSKHRTSLFGTRTWDTSLHDFLRLRVRSSGDGMRYFVNIQTDGPVRSDLFQHRLWLPAPASDDAPHEWTDVLIPFSDFTLTNSGDLSAQQMEMLRSKVRTIGISVLGPKEGRYELGIESIDAVSLDPSRAESYDNLPQQKDAQGNLI